MCGRFAFYSPSEAAAALFGVIDAPAVEAHYNIAPTQYVAAILEVDSARELRMLKWGLIPFWAKDAAIGNRMINARAETVAEKPAFRAAYQHRRCLVLADGFYEWHTEAGVKQPYFISLASGEPFAFAALWESWKPKDADEDQRIDSTTLLTMAANRFLQPLHHRMPVLLSPETANGWLAGEPVDAFTAVPKLSVWPVERRVNNARNEGADLIARIGNVRTG